MARTVQSTVYTFDELDDSAKERARDWYRDGIESDELTDYDDWSAVAAILGIEFDQHAVKRMGGGTRYDPKIWWSLSYSQGDGASFEGCYRYAKGAAKAIRAYAPTDKRLHQIADDLQDVQKRFGYRLSAMVTQGRYGGSYVHSGAMQVEVEYDGATDRELEGAAAEVRDALRSFADWIYDQIRAQDEYLRSDEAVDESIACNEYEFTEAGEIV